MGFRGCAVLGSKILGDSGAAGWPIGLFQAFGDRRVKIFFAGLQDFGSKL
jgi:hypothetical protein